MSAFNPYQPPQESFTPMQDATVAPSGEATPGMIEHLRATKAWVRFLSILGFIATGFTVLGSCSMMIAGAAMGSESAPFAGLGVFYLIGGALYAVPAYKLHLYANSIETVISSGSARSVEEALRKQREFWMISGIMVIAFFALAMVAFMAAMAFGVWRSGAFQ